MAYDVTVQTDSQEVKQILEFEIFTKNDKNDKIMNE